MTFKGKISKIWYVVIAVLNGIAIASLIYSGISTPMILSLVVLAAVDLYAIPVLFKNDVTVEKKEVVVHFGLLTKRIPISEIQIVRQLRDFSASFAADFDRVAIESRRMTTVYVSVEDEEEMIKEIIKKNRKIRHLI